MSSQDFPGPSWQDRPASDDWHSGYRPVSEDSYRQPNAAPLDQRSGRDSGHGSSGYGRTNGSQDYQNGYGSSGRAGGNASSSYGNGRGNGYGPGRTGHGGYGSASPGNGSRSAGMDGMSSGDHSVPGGRKVATGRRGAGRAGQDDGPLAGEDTGAWYRPSGRFGAAGSSARRSLTAGRSARSGYDDPGTGIGGRTGRFGAAGPHRPGGAGGGPRGPWDGRRGPQRGDRDMRALIDPDGRTPLPLKILRRLWYGQWWRHWTFKKAGLLFGALCATMALALVATFFVVLHTTRVPIHALGQPLSESSVVYFSNGKEVGCFCTAGRFPLNEDQIRKSKRLVAAVLAAEDRGFFTEGGISVTGLARALKNNLSGGSIQGGSTITEQFVKTYYDRSLIGHVSYGTKLKEIIVAIKLAQLEPKWWILTHYLNAIPLGSGANGVQAAAETYFHRSAWQLTVAQAAMIAAMIQAPGAYDPEHPTAVVPFLGNSLLQRWIYVLTNMVRDGAITQARFNGLVPDPTDANSKVNLKRFPKLRTSSLQAGWPGFRGYIMNLVANELAVNYHLQYSTTQLGNLGLQIHTTINERLMRGLYNAVSQAKAEMAARGVPMPYYVNMSAVLEKPGTGKIIAFYGGPGFGVKHCKRLHCSFNTILAGEPVGSSFKPYVLATAISQGMDVRKSVLNSHSPLCIPMDFPPYQHQLSKQTRNCNTPVGYWQFDESSENYKVNLNPWEATAVSNDPAFEDLIHWTGVQNVINMAQTLGVSQASIQGLNAQFGDRCRRRYKDCHPGSVTAALGAGNLTAVDQANTFSVLVSGGRLVTPHIISSVTKNGAPLEAHLVRVQAIPRAVAADTDYGLSFDTTNTPVGSGTGVPNAQWDRPMIAKTGTLGQQQVATQAWFVGAIPQYSLAIGMFTDRPGGRHPQILDGLPSIGGWTGGYGGAWPAWTWHAFMSQQFSSYPIKPLPTPIYTGTHPTFTKWVLALPPKKPKRCKQFPGPGGGPGGGNGGNGGGGNGHHHAMIAMASGGQGNGQCQKGGPLPKNSPSPNPTLPTPNPTSSSPQPTVTITTPGPSQSPSPTGSPSTSPPVPFVAPHRQRVPSRTVSTASASAFAILPNRLIRKPAWVLTSTRV